LKNKLFKSENHNKIEKNSNQINLQNGKRFETSDKLISRNNKTHVLDKNNKLN